MMKDPVLEEGGGVATGKGLRTTAQELLHIQVFITVCFDADFVNFTTKVCFLIPRYNL